MKNQKETNCSSCNTGAISSCESSQNTLKAETNTKLSSGCNKKDAGNNAWTSVAQNYDIKESCEEHKKMQEITSGAQLVNKKIKQ